MKGILYWRFCQKGRHLNLDMGLTEPGGFVKSMRWTCWIMVMVGDHAMEVLEALFLRAKLLDVDAVI